MDNTRSEWKFVVAVSVIVVALTFLPVIYGYMNESNDMKFMGLANGIVDSNTYFDYIVQSKAGAFLFVNSYDPESIKPFLISSVYWLMGVFSILLPPLFVWYFFRAALGMTFLLAAYYLISMVVQNVFARKISFAFLAFSSGFGGFLVLLSMLTGKLFGSAIDLRMQSAITFLSLNGQPHTLFSLLMMVLTYILFLKAFQKNSWKAYLYPGLTVFLLGFTHPFDLITVFAVLAVFLAVQAVKSRTITVKPVMVFAVGIVPLCYFLYLQLFNSVFREGWSAQNILMSPNPWGYILGYGLLSLFVVLFFVKWYSWDNLMKAHPALTLIVVWAFVNPFMLYSPLKIEARLVEGLHVPLSILAALGLTIYVLPYVKRYRKAVIAAVLIVTAFSNLFWLFTVMQQTNPSFVPETEFQNRAYLSTDELSALEWLKMNPEKEIVLSGYQIGNYIPRVAESTAFFGHWAQTTSFEEKRGIVSEFFSGNDLYRRQVLSENKIQYVYYGAEEQSFGDLGQNQFLKIVYKNDKIKIFKVDLQ